MASISLPSTKALQCRREYGFATRRNSLRKIRSSSTRTDLEKALRRRLRILFRYKLLVERGGWWSDTDIVCLSENVPDFDEFFAWQDSKVINNALLYFEAHHPVMVDCLDLAMKLGRNVRWGEAGPRMLTRVLQELGRSDRAMSPEVCYPVQWGHALELLQPSQASVIDQTDTILSILASLE